MGENNDSSLKYLSVKTRGEQNPSGKRKVYFTCHPQDFEFYFDKVCEDIFQTQDCAIYYTEDMTAPLPEQYLESDLGQMSLFVIPVTFRLLHEKNRAMDFDFAFATSEKHMIPVLPLMMEPGIDEFYEKRFGKREYYSPYGFDKTAISYEEKLKKYLSSVLLDDDTVERIRKAFDAYIFLSYRKKDRNHANELMGLIHKNPMYRDVAIWYDEFLTPGEDFEKDIKKALDKSELFALLVTPNLINEQNYVQTTEYPYAHNNAQKRILPAEMVETDKEELKKQYPGVPDCINAHTGNLDAAVLDGLKTISLRANEDDPEHCYLIGLAYLDGVDVEVNKDYALELITFAAEKDYPEAMKKLFNMYNNGNDRIQENYNEALKWVQRLYNYYLKTEGETEKHTLDCLYQLAVKKNQLGRNKEALKLQKKCYKLNCKVFGELHPDTVASLYAMADVYYDLGKCSSALTILNRCCQRQLKILDKEHNDTIKSLRMLAFKYNIHGEHKKAKDLYEKCYKFQYEVFGEKNLNTLDSLRDLASQYSTLGDYSKASELIEKYKEQCLNAFGKDDQRTIEWLCFLYHSIGNCIKAKDLQEEYCKLQCKLFGEEHPETIMSLSSLAFNYRILGDYQKTKSLQEKCYKLSCEVFGKFHSDTINSLRDLVKTCNILGERIKALELLNEYYEYQCNLSEDKDCDMFDSLHALAEAYSSLGEYSKALELFDKYYENKCNVLNKESSDKLELLNNIASAYSSIGDDERALELNKKSYELHCEVFGEENPYTLESLSDLALEYSIHDDQQKTVELLKKHYKLCCKVYGKRNFNSLLSLNDLSSQYSISGDYKKSLKLQKKVYILGCKALDDEGILMLFLWDLIGTYNKLEKYKKAKKILTKHYVRYCKKDYEKNDHAQSILNGLIKASMLDMDNKTVMNYCEMVYNANYALIPELAETVARMYDDNQMPDKAAVVRAKEKLQTE